MPRWKQPSPTSLLLSRRLVYPILLTVVGGRLVQLLRGGMNGQMTTCRPASTSASRMDDPDPRVPRARFPAHMLIVRSSSGTRARCPRQRAMALRVLNERINPADQEQVEGLVEAESFMQANNLGMTAAVRCSYWRRCGGRRSCWSRKPVC